MANTVKLKRGSGSDPSASDMVVGEPVIRTDTAELFFKKDDGSVAKVSGGGGGPDFKYLALRNAANNGSASYPGNDFTLVTSGTTNAITPAAANTLLVSYGGVIQKPNSGTSTSGITGFIIDGSRIKTATNLAAAPDFILYQESGGIGEPSDDTVTNAKVTSNAAIAGTKISPDFGTQNIVTSGIATINGGDVIIQSSAQPSVHLRDSGDNPDYILRNNDGAFIIYDSTNTTTRLQVNTDGHVDVTGNLDVGAGLDVTGNITATGNVTTGPVSTIQGTEGISASLYLIADDGDDNGDGWRINSNQDANDLTFANNLNSNYLDKFTLTNTGNATFAGTCTASSFVGGLPITNGVDNRVITASSSTAIQGEANLTFDGTSLRVGDAFTAHTGADNLIVGENTNGVNCGITILNHTGSDARICFADSGDTDGGMLKYVHNGDFLQIYAGGVEKIRTTGAGCSVFGDNSNYDTIKLEAQAAGGDPSISFGRYGFSTTSRGAAIKYEYVTANTQEQGHLAFYTNPSFNGTGSLNRRFQISSNGDLYADNTTINSFSDSRLKKNIADYTYDLAKFKQLKPKTFDWINPEEHVRDTAVRGFVAQEVQPIDAYYIKESTFGNKKDKELITDGKGLTSSLGANDAMYVSVINQLITKIETLETKVAALEGA